MIPRIRTLATALLLSSGLGGAAMAADSAVDLGVDGEGYVNVQMEVDHPVALVKKYLNDSSRAMLLAPDVLDAKSVPEGQCQRVSVTTRGLLSPLTYVVLRCPTNVGYTEKLLESGDFSAHNVEWTMTPTAAGGTMVTVKARTRLNFPVPQSTLAKIAGQSLKTSLQGLDKNLDQQVADTSSSDD